MLSRTQERVQRLCELGYRSLAVPLHTPASSDEPGQTVEGHLSFLNGIILGSKFQFSSYSNLNLSIMTADMCH